MSNYIGSKCPICHEPLKEEDDVVVCPICGAPYHRACYEKAGACIFPDLHETGKNYEPEFPKTAAEEVKPPEFTVCPRCGAKVDPKNAFCPACGAQVRQPAPGEPAAPEHPAIPLNPYGSPMAGLEPEDQMGDGHTVKDMMVFVRQNTPYFLIRFARYFRKLPIFDFNFSAAFFGPGYFLYRKMYGWAILIFSGMLLTEVGAAFSTVMMQNAVPLGNTLFLSCQLLNYGLRFAVGMLANRMYYRHCRKKMTAIRQELGICSEEVYYSRLTEKGGTSMMGVLFFFLGLMLLSGIVSAVMVAFFPDALSALFAAFQL